MEPVIGEILDGFKDLVGWSGTPIDFNTFRARYDGTGASLSECARGTAGLIGHRAYEPLRDVAMEYLAAREKFRKFLRSCNIHIN